MVNLIADQLATESQLKANQSPVTIEEMYALLKESQEQLTYGQGSRTGLASRIGELLNRSKEHGINLGVAKLCVKN